ncbi:MAG: methyltransferase [Pseudomonadota bacterium]
MSAVDPGPALGVFDRLRSRRDAVLSSPSFQRWAARFFLTKRAARRDGERLFDLVAGFTYSQILRAVVGFELPNRLASGPKSSGELALECGVPSASMARLCQGAAALDLLQRCRDGRYRLARLGAALRGVPGLQEMIRHHDILYGDLSDPEAFFRGDALPELAAFWPYVFGPGAERDPDQSARYSQLMADTQTLVADETLKAVDLSGIGELMDIGGGTGAFLRAALEHYPMLRGRLVDLPGVTAEPHARIMQSPADFRTDALPKGADGISLIRVLYDHSDDTVTALLTKVFDVLPPKGRILISEPMSGGSQPSRFGDVYFALYCMAMRTGTVRDPAQISALLTRAGFVSVRVARMDRPFITQAVTAEKP